MDRATFKSLQHDVYVLSNYMILVLQDSKRIRKVDIEEVKDQLFYIITYFE